MKLFKAALLAASMIVSAAPLAHAATPGNALVVAQNIDDIVSIDPAEAYEFTSGEYVTQTYDRLVQYDAPDVKTLAPGLATAWTADDACGRCGLFLEARHRAEQGACLHPGAAGLDPCKL